MACCEDAAVSDVAIIDNGGANIASLRYALERLGASSHLTSDAEELRAARRVILPGVGAAADAMQRLQALGLVETVRTLKQPVLGICLGMQLFFEASDEGDTTCLGLLLARVRRFPVRDGFPVPHMGWNQLESIADSPLLDGIASGDRVYYVHGYAAPVGPWTLATTDYGGPFSAVVQHRNFVGTQFHPERSGPVGARLLSNFLELDRPRRERRLGAQSLQRELQRGDVGAAVVDDHDVAHRRILTARPCWSVSRDRGRGRHVAARDRHP